MKKLIRLSLLMMLILTFIQNVDAKESSIDNDSLQQEIQETITQNEYLDTIPEEISLDNEEEDSFIVEDSETKTKAEIALQNKIKEIWEENNINPETDEVEYSVENKLNDNSIYDFTIHVKRGEEEDTKEIKVTYNNTAFKEEERQKKIDELLGEDKKIELIGYKDFYTFEGLDNPITLEEHLKELLKDEQISYYYRSSLTNDLYFSYEENGSVYVFSNGVLYELVPTTWKYVSQIPIRQELDNNYVLEQAQEKVEKEYEKSLPENDFEFREEENIYSTSENENYGKVNVKQLTNEELKSYEVQSGGNSTLNSNDPTLSVRVEGNVEKVIGVYVNGEKIKEEYYMVNKNGNVSFNKSFLKALAPGTYNLVVKFSDGDAKTTFTLKSEERVEQTQPVYRRTYYTTYTRVKENVEEEQEKVTEEKKEETSEPLTLEESKDSSKDKKPKDENKEIAKAPAKEEEKPNISWIPIVLIVSALGVIGGFGFLLYKKSKEEE